MWHPRLDPCCWYHSRLKCVPSTGSSTQQNEESKILTKLMSLLLSPTSHMPFFFLSTKDFFFCKDILADICLLTKIFNLHFNHLIHFLKDNKFLFYYCYHRFVVNFYFCFQKHLAHTAFSISLLVFSLTSLTWLAGKWLNFSHSLYK